MDTLAVGQPGLLAVVDWASLWQTISHNWALFSILLTLLVLVVVPVLVVAKYVRIILNIVRDTEPPVLGQLGFNAIPGEEMDLFATDGLRLRGIFMHPPPNVPYRGLVVFSPEFKSDRLSCVKYCQPLIRAGYDVLSFDFRGHAQSASQEGYTPRQWVSDREVADIMGVIAYAEQWLEKEGRPIELGLFGPSRGGGASILGAAECASVKAIITDGAFSSDAVLEHFMKRWAKIFAKVKFVYENHPPEFWRFLRWCLFLTCRFKFKCTFPSVRKTLARMVPRPMLFIHGDRDSYIPVEQSRLLYALSGQPRYLWIVPNAKHNQSVDIEPEEYARRTVQFFDKYLAGIETPENMYNDGRFEQIIRNELGTSHRLESKPGLSRDRLRRFDVDEAAVLPSPEQPSEN